MAGSTDEKEAAPRLTTHVLDLGIGRGAAGLALRVSRLEGGGAELVAQAVTNADGRCDRPLLAGEAFAPGTYEIVFEVGSYFAHRAPDVSSFLDAVPVRFVAAADLSHVHVPLLVSPFGYSTYRGS